VCATRNGLEVSRVSPATCCTSQRNRHGFANTADLDHDRRRKRPICAAAHLYENLRSPVICCERCTDTANQSVASAYEFVADCRKPYRISLTASLWRRFRNTGVLPKEYPASDPIIDAAKPQGGAGAVVNALSDRAADVAEWLRQYWPESRIEVSAKEDAPKATSGEATWFPVAMYRAPAVDPKTRIPDAELFLAVQTVLYLGIFFVHLRKLAISAIYTMLLLLLAATIYPFQPEGWIMSLMAGLSVTVAVVIGHVLVQVNRNELVSRIAGNEPNKFTPDWTFLWSNLALLAPFAVAAAQVSGSSSRSWR